MFPKHIALLFGRVPGRFKPTLRQKSLSVISQNTLNAVIKGCSAKTTVRRVGAGFCAKDEGGLSPGEDDKQHNAENTPLAAGSYMCAMLNLARVEFARVSSKIPNGGALRSAVLLLTVSGLYDKM